MTTVKKNIMGLLLIATMMGIVSGSTRLQSDPDTEILNYNWHSKQIFTEATTSPISSSSAQDIPEPPTIAKGLYVPETLSNYSLYLKLHEDESVVEGNLTVDFYNEDPETFTAIPFHLFPSGMSYDLRPGGIEILNVSIIDPHPQSLEFEVYDSLQLMWVNFPSEIAPGERRTFQIWFNTTLPDGGIDRANEHGLDVEQTRIFKFGSAYPLPCVFDDKDGWNTDPYLDVGDPFYNDMAFYSLDIEVPSGMKVAATGQLESRLIVGASETFHYDPLLPVREITFSASRYFQTESALVNGVNITTYFLPKSAWLWTDYALDRAIKAITLFSTTLGEYPYPTFNAVEEFTHYGGMEYPLQVYITETATYYAEPEKFLELVIAHETAHQWFYQLVGVDEVDSGFLDEGIVVWLTDFYKHVYHLDWDVFSPYWALFTVRTYFGQTSLPNKINQTSYECITSGTDYWYTAYRKTPMIWEKLRLTIGNDSFFEGLRLIFSRHQFQFAWLPDFQQAFEEVVESSLDWYFLPWFDNSYLPDYEFQNIRFDTHEMYLSFKIADLNEPYNTYQYKQLIHFEFYNAADQLITGEGIWVHGNPTISLTLTEVPRSVKLVYTQDVLLQVAYPDIEAKVSSTISFFDSNSTTDPSSTDSTDSSDTSDPLEIGGFPLLFMSFPILLGIAAISFRMTKKKRTG